MLWLVVAYLGSIAILLLSALWQTDSFTGNVTHAASLGNLQAVYTEPLYRHATTRTLLVALLVTLVDAGIALPMALYMSQIGRASCRERV